MSVVFFSYSHADEQLRNELEKHLSMLKRQGAITTWHDRKIVAGDALDKSVSNWLESSQIILLLVSIDFLNSDYCYGIEMKRAMERHSAGDARVIPVILRPCDWHSAPFGNLLATPTDGKPVVLWPNQDEAFLEVTKAIRTALASLKGSPDINRAKSVSPATPVVGDIRSSNLRVKKQFTDRDKDAFLGESYEYIARFFQNSLKELSARNPEIETGFVNEPRQFEATAYRNGKVVARCLVALSDRARSFGDGITLSYGTHTLSRNSINESLSVEVGEQSLSLKPLGLAILRQQGDGALSQEGAAEHFWSIFIEPLQR